MRKQAAFAVLFIFAAAAAFAQTAQLTEPKTGASLAIGMTAPISWNASGSTWIKLVLFRNGSSKVGVIKANLALKVGSYSWRAGFLENGNVAPAGNDYAIRVMNMADDAVLNTGPTFSLFAPTKQSRIPVQVKSPVPGIKNYFLNAVPPPAGTTFAIKKIDYGFESEGKLAFVVVLISVNSPKEFAISPDYGDPQFGAQWIYCQIENPVYEGFSCDGCSSSAYSGTFSVKGGGNSQPFSQYPAAALPAGQRDYTLSFTPVYPGQAKGIGIFQKMPSGIFEPGKLCKREFYPKLKIDLTVSTAQGALKGGMSVYLLYDPNRWPLKWFSLPGETNVCVGGVQNW